MAHGVLISCFTPAHIIDIPYCGIVEVDFDESQTCAEFVVDISEFDE